MLPLKALIYCCCDVFKHEKIVRCITVYIIRFTTSNEVLWACKYACYQYMQGEKCFLRILFNQTRLRWISPSKCNLILWISSSFSHAWTTRITQRVTFFPILIYRLRNTVSIQYWKTVLSCLPPKAQSIMGCMKRENTYYHHWLKIFLRFWLA